MRLSKTQSNRLKNQSKRQSTRLDKGFSSSAGWGQKTPPQTPPLASTQQTSKIKGLGESKFHRNFVLFLPIFALNLMDFQRFFYEFSEVFNAFCMKFEASCVRFRLWLVTHEVVILIDGVVQLMPF